MNPALRSARPNADSAMLETTRRVQPRPRPVCGPQPGVKQPDATVQHRAPVGDRQHVAPQGAHAREAARLEEYLSGFVRVCVEEVDATARLEVLHGASQEGQGGEERAV